MTLCRKFPHLVWLSAASGMNVSCLFSIVECTVYLFFFFYLRFDPKPAAITVTFVTQPFQFNFTTTALSWLTISRLRSAGFSFFCVLFYIPSHLFCEFSELENAGADILWVQEKLLYDFPLTVQYIPRVLAH